MSILLWWHAETAFAAAPPKQVRTLIVLKNDLIRPATGAQYMQNAATMFWSYGRLGMAFDGTLRRKFDYLDFKPYGLFQIKPFYALAGFSTASSGSEYLFAGIWYVNKHHNLSVFLDARNFWSLQKGVSYIDNFLEISGSPGKKTWLAFDAIYDHWWDAKSRHFLLVGPAAGIYIAKPILLFTRVSREWSWAENAETKTANRFRLGLRFSF